MFPCNIWKVFPFTCLETIHNIFQVFKRLKNHLFSLVCLLTKPIYYYHHYMVHYCSSNILLIKAINHRNKWLFPLTSEELLYTNLKVTKVDLFIEKPAHLLLAKVSTTHPKENAHGKYFDYHYCFVQSKVHNNTKYKTLIWMFSLFAYEFYNSVNLRYIYKIFNK